MKIPNPYIVGNPIEDRKLFFGREDNFAFIKQKISGQDKGGILVLCGSRRSGKTSILFQIKGGRLGPGFVPVLIDMQAMVVNDDGDFIEEIVEGLMEALGNPDLPEGESFEECLARREGNAHRAFREFSKYLKGPLGGRKIVLLFDEYELIETHIRKDRFTNDVLHTLANWMEQGDGVFLIFTGSDKLEKRQPVFWEQFLAKSPFHQRISFLSENDARRLATEPVAGHVSYQEGCLEQLWRIAAGQPFYTQVICQALVDRLNEHDTREVTREDVEGVLAEIVENPLPQMVFTWSGLDPNEKLTLALVAECTSGPDDWVVPSDLHEFADAEGIPCEVSSIKEAMEALFLKDMLTKKGEEAIYRFKMDLWRRWIARMHSIWQVVNELGLVAQKGGSKRIRPRTWLGIAVILVPLVVFGALQLMQDGDIETPTVPTDYTNLPQTHVDQPLLISITSEPEGASVSVGDSVVAQTPMTNFEISEDSVMVRVFKQGFAEKSEWIFPGTDGFEHRHFYLDPLPGSVQVGSSPSGATVRLSGHTGTWTTPCLIEGLEGNRNHDLRLSLSNFGSEGRTIWVSRDSLSTVSVEMSKTLYRVMVTSEPRSSVSDGSGKLGTTPLSLERPAGRYTYQFEAEGYESAERTIAFPGEDAVHLVLPRLSPGYLQAVTKPYGHVLVDGRLVSENKLFHPVLELESGDYRVELQFMDAIEERMVTISPRDTTVVRHDFAGNEGQE